MHCSQKRGAVRRGAGEGGGGPPHGPGPPSIPRNGKQAQSMMHRRIEERQKKGQHRQSTMGLFSGPREGSPLITTDPYFELSKAGERRLLYGNSPANDTVLADLNLARE
ncbi:hypothetical protein KP509_33G005400 [Ceratopteris richardii]|uniref:Uncharacterized protein n=1 Tax=Ceratopteris richardii TaxID=49495 RepID=A0A8T2QNT3_CERRI|nr:hypothetical protein KP509_33G005400 [Ceratopteris richardii]